MIRTVEKAISDTDALAVVKTIKVSSDKDGVKLIQTLMDVAQDKIIQYIKELKNGRL